jgi:hypothetical protein
VPLLAFAGAAGLSWWQVQAEARVRLTRTIDMLHEHALRSFEMQEAILTAADGRVVGMSWKQIAASREVHAFLRSLAQLRQSYWEVSRKPLISHGETSEIPVFPKNVVPFTAVFSA